MPDRTPRVLIVDDEPRNLALLEALLAPLGLDIVRAAGGREAISAYVSEIGRGGFDVVLLDVMMPEVDGLTALAAMRDATPRDHRIPIVLVTALHERSDRLRGLEAGADDFLTKPLDPHEVRCRVRTFLSLRAAQRTLAERAAQLERLQRDRAELSRMLVHDLKNPLAALESNLAWIAQKLQGGNAALVEALDDSTASAARLLNLIGGLVDIDRAEDGRLTPDRSHVVLADHLDAIARRHRREADFRGVTIVVEVEPGCAADLDAALVARAVENLVENAIRYTPRAGRIALQARRAPFGLELAVANTGQPIKESTRATIFEKYVTSESRGHHQGLGLYFCRVVAEAHGGSIAIETTDAWPTRFVLKLPVTPPPPAERRRAAFAPDEAGC